MTESVLGMALLQGHHADEAAHALARARQALGTNAAATPYIQVTLLENEADLALAQGRPAEAARRYDTAIDAATKTYPAGYRRLSMLRLGLGLALVEEGHAVDGKALLRQSLQAVGQRPDCRGNQIAMAREWLR
jgi:serine/threonine-protein kinase